MHLYLCASTLTSTCLLLCLPSRLLQFCAPRVAGNEKLSWLPSQPWLLSACCLLRLTPLLRHTLLLHLCIHRGSDYEGAWPHPISAGDSALQASRLWQCMLDAQAVHCRRADSAVQVGREALQVGHGAGQVGRAECTAANGIASASAVASVPLWSLSSDHPHLLSTQITRAYPHHSSAPSPLTHTHVTHSHPHHFFTLTGRPRSS